MRKLKDPLTYDGQIDHLTGYHNLTIPDKKRAINILSKTNYYRLSAYGIGLKKKDNKEEYVDGTSIEDLYAIYRFDSRFRNLIFNLIDTIEIRLRSQIAYRLANNHGAECLMDRGNFKIAETVNGKQQYDTIIKAFNSERKRQANLPFVKHHETEYGGHYPIWVAVELFSFGNMSRLYGIMDFDDQKAVADIYNTSPDYLNSWVQALVEVRNICAHYQRLYNMPLKQRPSLYREQRKYTQNKQNKIFPVLLVLKRMIAQDEDDKQKWKRFVEDLESLISEYGHVIKLEFMNFPKEWKSVLSL